MSNLTPNQPSPSGRSHTSSRMPRRILTIALGLVLLVLLAYIGFSFYAAAQLTASSHRALTTTPADYGASYEEIQFASAVDNLSLSGWYIGKGGRPVIIVMHARDGVRDDSSIGLNEITPALVRAGYDVFTFDFRAHGKSGGAVEGFGKAETRDVAGALNYLRTRGVTQVGAYGCSLGANTALLAMADQPEIRVLVGDSAFAVAEPAVEIGFAKQTGLPTFLLPGILFAARQMYGLDVYGSRPVDAIARVGDRPILLIHGAQDSYVPIDNLYQLQRAGAGDPNLQTWVVPGAEHCRSYKEHPTEYKDRVLAFFRQYLK